MGNDGGSIVKRDFVKTKSKGEQADKSNQNRAAWNTCALSKKELREPVVACPLGKLYNKDALLEFLLVPASSATSIANTPFGADGQAIAGHITSLKDVLQLNLTPNPDFALRNSKTSQAGAEEGFSVAKWICPLSQREMNGAVRFVALKHKCRNVVAEASLKAMRSGKEISDVCGVCGEAYAEGEKEETLLLNPTDKDEVEKIKVAWEETKRIAKEQKKAKKSASSKKRKGIEDAEDVPLKKAKALVNIVPQSNGTPKLPMAVAEALEAKKQSSNSSAVSALYQRDPSKKQTWMTMSASFGR